MKIISAIIRPEKLEDLNSVLTNIGISGLTVTEVKGYGRQKGHVASYRGAEDEINFVPKVKIEVAVEDDLADKVDQAIMNTAKNNKIGDGKIFIQKLTDIIRIRTGDSGTSAV